MSLLIDKLCDPSALIRMPDKAYYGSARQVIIDELPKAEVFKINNVASYFFDAMFGSEDQIDQFNRWNIKRDFPNLAPPFNKMWLEFDIDTQMRSRLVRAGIDSSVEQMGALFLAFSMKELKVVSLGEDMPALRYEDGASWLCLIYPFTGLRDGGICGPMFLQTIPIRGDGSFFDLDPNGKGGILFTSYDESYSDVALQSAKLIVYPCLLAISFLHCKNIVTFSAQSPRYERRRAQRECRPIVIFKTLEITPMKEVLRREGQSESLGLKKALHICRGHFATYSEERPLFGRVPGTFWKPMHVRGAAEQGAVVKDYAVNKPKGKWR